MTKKIILDIKNKKSNKPQILVFKILDAILSFDQDMKLLLLLLSYLADEARGRNLSKLITIS